MSIMDFFASQGTAQPSTGSSRGNWEDWFLDMEGRKPFGKTVYPDDDERGDWIDWYLNREGPAGRFEGSRRPRYDIDYLFNGGGSVQSGPRTRQKLGDRGIETLLNATQNRINTEQNRWEGAGGEGSYPVFNQPNPDQRRHVLDEMSSGWLEASAPRNNLGYTAAMTDYSPNGKGRWITQSPTGNKLLSYLTSKFGSEGSSEYLEDAIGGGGVPLWGGYMRPTYEDGNVGVMWSSGG